MHGQAWKQRDTTPTFNLTDPLIFLFFLVDADRHNEETKNDYAGTGPHAYSEIDKSDQFPTAYEV